MPFLCFCVSLFHGTNFHAIQALMSMIHIFRALSIYLIFIPLYVIDADQTLADQVTWSRCSHLYFSNTSMDPQHVPTVNRTPAVSGLIAQINPIWGLEVF